VISVSIGFVYFYVVIGFVFPVLRKQDQEISCEEHFHYLLFCGMQNLYSIESYKNCHAIYDF